jgi:hypothetical protein
MPHTLAALGHGAISEWRATLLARETLFLSCEHRERDQGCWHQGQPAQQRHDVSPPLDAILHLQTFSRTCGILLNFAE